MNSQKKMREIISHKQELGSEKKPKYGTRKLSVGLVSCMLGFSLIIAPGSSKADAVEENETVAAETKDEVPEEDNKEIETYSALPKDDVEEKETPAEEKDASAEAETPAEEETKKVKPENELYSPIAAQGVEYSDDLKFVDLIQNIDTLPENVSYQFVKKPTKEDPVAKVKVVYVDGTYDLVEVTLKVSEESKEEKVNTNLSFYANENASEGEAINESEETTKEEINENWKAEPKNPSNWSVDKDQKLVRVSTSDPVEINDVGYDGSFVNADGRTVLRLVYKEKTASLSAVWTRALFNFGDLKDKIDFDKTYALGNYGKTQYKLTPYGDRDYRMLDIYQAAGDRTQQRKNIPINIVLNEGQTLESLGKKNFIIQMRLTDDSGKRVYANAPGKTAMDYSTYTKTTSVSLEDRIDSIFMKGGHQKDQIKIANQQSFMSEFIAEPEGYDKDTGIIRTQYKTQRDPGSETPTVGGQPIAFVQAFDAELVDFLKADDKGNIAYTTFLTEDKTEPNYAHRFGIKKSDINYKTDPNTGKKLAYVLIGTNTFNLTRTDIKKVDVAKLDQYLIKGGIYFTSVDYVVDKSKFEDSFRKGNTNKIDYSSITGWVNPNNDGWTIFEKNYEEDHVINPGESFLIDTTKIPQGKQIMIQVGDKTQAILRRPQGYYNGAVIADAGIAKIEKYAEGVYKFTLPDGRTIKKGDKFRVIMPYTSEHDANVEFLAINNATKWNEGAANLNLNKDRNITLHMFTKEKGGKFKLYYTLKGETEEKSIEFTKGGLWKFNDKDKVLTGIPNTATDGAGGNVYINTKKLEPGKDIRVEALDAKGNLKEDFTSSFKYVNIPKSNDKYTDLTWVDHTDTSSILSINKSLYKPYTEIFTNDYAEGQDDFYKDPRVNPADETAFMKDTTNIVGYTKYDGGKIRMIYLDPKTKEAKVIVKADAEGNEYYKDGKLVGKDKSVEINLNGDNYNTFKYDIDLKGRSEFVSSSRARRAAAEEKPAPKLYKDMKLSFTASDGSSIPSDMAHSRVRTRVLFDATDGAIGTDKKQVKVVPDNVKFYGEEGYKANGFTGEGVQAGTGDAFVANPTAAGKTFLGWVTEDGKTALGNTVVTSEDFNKLSAQQKFTSETPVERHQVVYAIWSEEKLITFDANGGSFEGGDKTKTDDLKDGAQAPADPTQAGKTFKGWATTPTATAPDANLATIAEPTTLYAVWGEDDQAKDLQLAPPAKTEVANKDSVTPEEQGKIKEAVKAANPTLNLEDGDIRVDEKGNVTVNKDGKTGKLTPEQTIEEKAPEAALILTDPAVTEVTDPEHLTDTEKQAVKDAIKAKNPGLEDGDIEVADNGKATVTKDGKTAELPAEKTVKAKQAPQADGIEPKAEPSKVEVGKAAESTLKIYATDKDGNLVDKDGNPLTDANGQPTKDPSEVTDPSKLVEKELPEAKEGQEATKFEKDPAKEITAPEGINKDAITVDPTTGKVTLPQEEADKLKPGEKVVVPVKVTYPDGTTDTVDVVFEKPAEEAKVDKAPLQAEADKENATKGSNKYNNADPDKKKAYDKALEDAKKVLADPNATQEEVDAAKKALTDAEKALNGLNAPAKTEVKDPSKLTPEEKKAVEKAVRDANPDLSKDAKVEVANDGTVTVIDGDKTSSLTPDKTVEKASVDKAPLEKEASDEAAIKASDRYNNADPAKKKAYEDALAKAKEALADPNATQEEVDAAKDALKAAEDALDGKAKPEVNKDALRAEASDEAAIKASDRYNNADPAKKKAYEDALAKAKEVLADPNASQDQVDAAKKALADAEKALDGKKAVDKTQLQAESDNEILVKTDVKYTNASADKAEAYDKALDEANKVLADPDATQEEVDEALKKLQDAKNALDGSENQDEVDKSLLEAEASDEAAIKASDRYNNADPAKKKAYEDALAKAKEVLANPNATQEEVDAAKDALKAAEDALDGKATPEVNKEALREEASDEAAIKASDRYNNADPAKKKAYEDALAKAKEVLADPNATQEEVDKAKKALADAEAGLDGQATPEVDKSKLQAETDKENTVKSDVKFTNASEDKKKAYEDALAKAKEVLADSNASQEEVDKALKALEEAEKALDGKATVEVDKTALQNEANKESDVKVSDKYKNADKEKQRAYDEALAAAKAILEDPKASQEQVDNALKALQDAEVRLDGKAIEEEKIDKSKLEEEVKKESDVKSKDSYKNADKALIDAYEKALDKAKKVLKDPKASQDEVDKARKELEDARLKLKAKDEKESNKDQKAQRKTEDIQKVKTQYNKSNNVKTGVGSVSAIVATLSAAVSGLFASKKRKNK